MVVGDGVAMGRRSRPLISPWPSTVRVTLNFDDWLAVTTNTSSVGVLVVTESSRRLVRPPSAALSWAGDTWARKVPSK